MVCEEHIGYASGKAAHLQVAVFSFFFSHFLSLSWKCYTECVLLVEPENQS